MMSNWSQEEAIQLISDIPMSGDDYMDLYRELMAREQWGNEELLSHLRNIPMSQDAMVSLESALED